jgi:hypothetical protein
MSAELDRIRARLCSTSTLLQQHKQLAAVLAVHEAVHGLQRLRPGMSTPECTEIERLTERSIGLLSSSPDTTTLSLLPLEYVSGKEDDLLGPFAGRFWNRPLIPHFRKPGRSWKRSIATGSSSWRAA